MKKIQDMNIDDLYSKYARYPKIVTDSRKAEAGSIFFALKGEQFDGNNFAMQALASGCNYAVVDRPEIATDNRFIPVDDVLNALQELACEHRKKLNIPVIAITGSNGKTTTKELIRSVLKTKYEVYATSGNLNNHIGVPLTILGIPIHTQITIIEMGANHLGEIKILCEIAQPTCGLITNIGKAHLEGFGSLDGVKQAKKELYDYLNEHNGTIFYNKENQILTDILKQAKAKTIGYGLSSSLSSLPSSPNCWGNVLSASPYLQAELHIDEESFSVSTFLAGIYNFENLLAATCVGKWFEVPAQQIVAALADYKPQNNRSQIFHTTRNQLLLDDYNANPTSMNKSLNNFFEQIQGPRMVILGDMFELGDEAPQEHAAIVDMLLPHDDIVRVVVGKHFYEAAKNTPNILSFNEMEDLKNWLVNHPLADMFILIKGSRGMKLEQITDLL